MPLLTALLSPLALMLAPPLGGAVGGEPKVDQAPPTAQAPMSDRMAEWLGLIDLADAPSAEQVRVEGRVILRITPRPMPSRADLLSQFDDAPMSVRFVERAVRPCLAMREIAGVSDRGDRLMLFLRDNRILVAELERACSPRDFYRGFYLERSEDGMMCAGRDRLMSRSGAKCQLRGLRELVQVVDRR